MIDVAATIAAHDSFLRRRDLLALSYSDDDLRGALEAGRTFRVRHGWYSVPSAPAEAVAAVRVGGRLTGRSALLTYGIPVPYPRRDRSSSRSARADSGGPPIGALA